MSTTKLWNLSATACSLARLLIEPPVIPSFTVPTPVNLPAPVLELPSAEIPSYRPLYVPATVEAGSVEPGEVQQEEEQEELPKKETTETLKAPRTLPIQIPKENRQDEEAYFDGVTTFSIFGTNVPVPKPEILVAASTTATASVAATLTATWTIKRLTSVLKPIVKQAVKRLQKLRGKKAQSWGRERLAQRRSRRQRKGTQGVS